MLVNELSNRDENRVASIYTGCRDVMMIGA